MNRRLELVATTVRNDMTCQFRLVRGKTPPYDEYRPTNPLAHATCEFAGRPFLPLHLVNHLRDEMGYRVEVLV